MATPSKETPNESNDPSHEKQSIDQGELNESSRAPDVSFAMMQQNFFPFPFLMPPGLQAPSEATNKESSAFNIPGLSIPLSDRRPLRVQWGKKRNAKPEVLSARRLPKSKKTTAPGEKPKAKAAASIQQPTHNDETASVQETKSKANNASGRQQKSKAKTTWARQAKSKANNALEEQAKSKMKTASARQSKSKANNSFVRQQKSNTSVQRPKSIAKTASAQQAKSQANASLGEPPKSQARTASAVQVKSKRNTASAQQPTLEVSSVSEEQSTPKASAASLQQPPPKVNNASIEPSQVETAAEAKVDDDDQSDLVCLHPVHLKPDQIADLEHVIRVGGNFKSTDLRIQEYLNSGTNKTKVTRGTSHVTAKVDGLHLHGEDCRIYATQYGFQNDPWPREPGKSSKSKKNAVLPDDTLWDQEHGDGMHPLAFEALRLSSHIPRTKKQKQELESLSYLELKGTVNVKAGDVPQLLLSRAWERAVHAAASYVRPASLQRDFQQEDTYRSVTLTRDRCARLGIRLFGGEEKALKCPCCKLFFESSPALETHFFGKRTTYGCAWRLIEAKEKELVSKTLQAAARSQIDTLFQLVVSSVRQTRGGNGGTRNVNDVLDWQNILEILRDKIGTSEISARESSILKTCNPLLDTIQINVEEPPLLMNDLLLRSIEARLHDRYANVEGKAL